jgi:hypothetical protein
MHGAQLVAEETVRAQEKESNLKMQRMVEVRLGPDWPRPIVLNWNQGIIGKTIGAKTRRVVKPGQSTLLDIARAQSYFGMFTLPRDIEDVYDEKKREDLLAQFRLEKTRALLFWGDFPRAQNHERDGNEPLGPHRFPDVFVTVIEADGDKWPEMGLRELYELEGQYTLACEPKSRAKLTAQTSIASDMIAKFNTMEKENAELKGLVHGFLAGRQIDDRSNAVAAAKAVAPRGSKPVVEVDDGDPDPPFDNGS